MKVRDHLSNSNDSSRHAVDHVDLVPIVDAQVGVRRPNQDRVDASIPLLQIIQVPVHGVFSGDGVKEKAVLHHHLRLDEAGLRP